MGKLSRAAAVVAGAVFAVLCAWRWWAHRDVTPGMAVVPLDTETARLASTMYFEQLNTVAQATIAVFGAAWALLIVAESNKGLARTAPGMTLFALTNLSLALSLWVYYDGYSFVVSRIFHYGAFDIDAPFVILVKESQLWFFLFGLVALGAAILVGRETSRSRQ